MHVFHIITTLNKGGAESHLLDLCRALRRRGCQVTVAYIKGDGYWVTELEKVGVATIALDARRYTDPAAILRLRQAIDRRRPDIVHAHMPPAELYALLALGGRPHIPMVTSKHNDQEPFYRGPGAQFLERVSAKRAHTVIAISDAVRRYFAAAWPASLRHKLVTVRYGLAPIEHGKEAVEAARALRTQWNVAPDEVLFGIVARLVEQKSIDTLLRAFASLRATSPTPVRLVIVGHGPLENQMRALANELAIADDVVWAGFRTDIATVMRSLDVFVLSSIYEGFGLVLLEAMEASLPVVASRVSAIPEIVVEGETGYLVPPRDPEALSAAMNRTLDFGVRQQMGRAGHARLLDQFAVDQMADKTLAIYERVLDRGASTKQTSSR